MVSSAELLAQVSPDADSDREELAGLARRLWARLLDLDVDAVEPWTADNVPEGAKGLATLALQEPVRRVRRLKAYSVCTQLPSIP